MWRHAQRAARQTLQSFASSGACGRGASAACPIAASCGKAAMKASAASRCASGGLASSPGFQSFKQSMGARSMMGFAASAPSVVSPGRSPSSMGSNSSAQVSCSSMVTASGESTDDDSSPTNTGSSAASSSSSSDDEEGDPVRRRRTILQPKRGFDGLPDATAAAHGPPPSTLFFSWRASAAGPCRAQASSTSTAFDPSLHHTQLRALHTSNFQHYAGPSDSRRGPAGADPGVGAGTTKPTSDMLAGNLIFAKESFLKKPEGALPIPMPIREVMYQHRWDKVLVDVRRAVSYVRTEGKREQYTAMVAVGNMNGLFGLGLGDAPTAQEAVAAAYLDAFNKLTSVPLYRGHTIFNHIEHKYNSLKFLISPRPDGWGITANDLLLELCNLAGIRNISIKVYGRRRPKFYVAAGFLEALQRQTMPHDGIEGSGVYVREVMLSRSSRPRV